MFAGVALNVVAPEALAAFYVDRLGLRVLQQAPYIRLGYGGLGACLELRPSPIPQPYRHDGQDTYWKTGITLPNIDIAHEQLRRAGVAVTEPRQFQAIGYMCHFTDPEGFQIELLQHTFQDTPRTVAGDPAQRLGGGGQIGQITLRTNDIDAALGLYRTWRGMQLLSVQPVDGRDFTLYFLAHTRESPPDPDLEAVSNRPWLWQRPYTTLELQHVHGPANRIRPPSPNGAGYAGLLFEDSEP